MKKILAGLVVVIMVLYFAINKQESNTLVIYSALEQYRNDAVSYTHLSLPTICSV